MQKIESKNIFSSLQIGAQRQEGNYSIATHFSKGIDWKED